MSVQHLGVLKSYSYNRNKSDDNDRDSYDGIDKFNDRNDKDRI
jgi:hypothetical protein